MSPFTDVKASSPLHPQLLLPSTCISRFSTATCLSSTPHARTTSANQTMVAVCEVNSLCPMRLFLHPKPQHTAATKTRCEMGDTSAPSALCPAPCLRVHRFRSTEKPRQTQDPLPSVQLRVSSSTSRTLSFLHYPQHRIQSAPSLSQCDIRLPPSRHCVSCRECRVFPHRSV